MIPLKNPEKTRTLGKPDSWDERDCSSLDIQDVVQELPSGEFTRAMVSLWEPTDAELTALIGGAKLVLTIVGTQHPPVMLSVREDSE